MSLYNKYIPKNLSDVVGQDIIVQILKKLDNNFNGIIFSGIHGIGKTLLAKLFTKKINCLKGKDEPCNICENCIAIDNNIEDIIETDGATNTGIDNIRQIKEDIIYLPFQLKYKIYIIDEVHRLSQNAFDALLITLQNPPAHVKFIFATTDLNKLPDTFLSRCLVFPLKKISIQNIKTYISNICKLEKKQISEESIEIIAKTANGSMRQAISCLEPLLLLDNINENELYDYLNIINVDKCLHILKFILDGNPKEAILYWRKLNDIGYDEKSFFHKLSEVIKNIFLIKINCQIEDKEIYEFLIDKYDISFNLLINFWEIIISQMEALYNNCDFLIETTILMLCLIEEQTDLVKKVKNPYKLEF